MNHSESIVNLAPALVRAQAEVSAVIENKQNPFLKSSYADLGAVIEAIRKPFEKNGLALVQFPVGQGGEIGVESVIIHSSGEWMSERVMMQTGEEKGKSDAQVAGSVISYLRRYGISSIARLYTEDNDGQTSSRQNPVSAPAASENKTTNNTATTTQPQRATPARSHPPLSPTQRNKMTELWRILHGGNDDEVQDGLDKLFQESFGHGISQAKYEEGARLTGKLLAELRQKQGEAK